MECLQLDALSNDEEVLSKLSEEIDDDMTESFSEDKSSTASSTQSLENYMSDESTNGVT